MTKTWSPSRWNLEKPEDFYQYFRKFSVEGKENPMNRVLESEFYVDPDRLTPLYRTEEGPISLEERVKIFLDEPENWNLVRSKIAQGGGTSGKAGASSRPAFTRAELKEMRAKRPEEYKARQTEIQRAYKEGRVRPD